MKHLKQPETPSGSFGFLYLYCSTGRSLGVFSIRSLYYPLASYKKPENLEPSYTDD